MVTLATSSSERRIKNNPSRISSGLVKDKRFKDLHFDLAFDLQSSLELDSTLEAFFNGIQSFVTVSGLHYRDHNNPELQLSFGTNRRHTITYNIASDEVQLGEIVFSRDKRFLNSELAVIEILIGVLFMPLRNALLYRAAIDASMHDPLTGIGNRAALDTCFARELKLAIRHSHSLCALLIDIDHFKRINDSVGHLNGDKALQQVVDVIKNTLRETDQVFRYGGEEFVALLHNTGPSDASLIAERIRLNTAMSPLSLDNQDLLCTVSIGIGVMAADDSVDSLLQKADAALYLAKQNGRNRVEFWTEDQTKKETQPDSPFGRKLARG